MKANAPYFQPAFLICVAVLAVAGGGLPLATQGLGLYLEKEPLPLKESLDRLDEAALVPYRVVAREKIENEDIREALGTDDYIQWVLEDPRQPQASPVRRVLLFITYYPAPDRVPHVPEECYTGSGYQRLATEDIRFLAGADRPARDIPGRCLLFGPAPGAALPVATPFPVLYFFRLL